MNSRSANAGSRFIGDESRNTFIDGFQGLLNGESNLGDYTSLSNNEEDFENFDYDFQIEMAALMQPESPQIPSNSLAVPTSQSSQTLQNSNFAASDLDFTGNARLVSHESQGSNDVEIICYGMVSARPENTSDFGIYNLKLIYFCIYIAAPSAGQISRRDDGALPKAK